LEVLEGRRVPANVYVVTNTGDAGVMDPAFNDPSKGDLRYCIAQSNANPPPAGQTNTILFQIGPADNGTRTISVAKSLSVTAPVMIDGYSQPGSTFNTQPFTDNKVLKVIVDGGGAALPILDISASNSTVRGLTVQNSSGDGIRLNNANNDFITGDIITSNGDDGIYVFGSSVTDTIGGATPDARNLISGNTNNGIHISGTSGAGKLTVQGNFIGINAAGTAAQANGRNGILIESGSSNNTIGGTAAGAGNIISGNGADGVLITGATSTTNQLMQNFIGTDPNANKAIGNGVNGVHITDAQSNTIGGTALTAGNIISGNTGPGATGSGVLIDGAATKNVLLNNYIGTNNNGTVAIKNAVGVRIRADGNTIGGAAANSRNVISGNGTGITINASNTVVKGNYIGLTANGKATLPNTGSGVIVNGKTNQIGGAAAGEGNVISGNKGSGIEVNMGANGTIIKGNYIGTDAAGLAAVGNGQDGISVSGAANTTIGGGGPGMATSSPPTAPPRR
jgi:parallel beta-helix repeat protein